MQIIRGNNPYYLAYLESRVVALLNNEEYSIPYMIHRFSFTEEEILNMEKAAKKIANEINSSHAEWIRKKVYSNEAGIKIGEDKIKINYFSVYDKQILDIPLSYLEEKYSLGSFRELLEEKIYPMLKEFYGDKIYENSSPLTEAESHDLQEKHPKEYKELVKLDTSVRTEYAKILYSFFNDNQDKLEEFITDIINEYLNKDCSFEKLFSYGYKTNMLQIKDKAGIQDVIKNEAFKQDVFGLIFKNFKIIIDWQYNVCFGEPVLKVYLK